VGVSFDGRSPGPAFLDQARAAEAAGAASLWIASHLFLRDPFTSAALALAATRRPRAALMAVSPYTVHPVQAAMAAATLDEHFPGRVALCFGSGAPVDLAGAGVETTRPVRTLREALEIARALLAGEPVRYEGEVFRIRERALGTGRRPVPLFLAASGPKTLELAGAAADGVLVSAASSVEFIRWALEQVARGAQGRAMRRVGLLYAAVAGREADALDRFRRTLAITLRGAHHRRNLDLAGSSLDQAALTQAVAAEDWAAAERLVSDDVVRRHAASGTAAQVRARVAAYAAAGLDEVVIAGMGDPAEIDKTLTAAGAAREDR
jgi:5,10-methylenetetrahydromethanopterin reductase